jgi:predicted nucleotidyltransferase
VTTRTDGAGQSALLMVEIAQRLADRGVPYCVVGAMAGAVHGMIRASVDADALLALDAHEARDLAAALRSCGYRTEVRIGDFDDPIPALIQVWDAFGNRVDLLVGLRRQDPEVMQRTCAVNLAGATLRVVGLEDYLAMKLYAGGPLDLADARAVMAVNRDQLDKPLLQRLVACFGRDASQRLTTLMADQDCGST